MPSLKLHLYVAELGVGLRDVYDWLGYVQEHLVVTLTSR